MIYKSSKKGFSLIEITISVAIMTLCAALFVVNMPKKAKTKTNSVERTKMICYKDGSGEVKVIMNDGTTLKDCYYEFNGSKNVTIYLIGGGGAGARANADNISIDPADSTKLTGTIISGSNGDAGNTVTFSTELSKIVLLKDDKIGNKGCNTDVNTDETGCNEDTPDGNISGNGGNTSYKGYVAEGGAKGTNIETSVVYPYDSSAPPFITSWNGDVFDGSLSKYVFENFSANQDEYKNIAGNCDAGSCDVINGRANNQVSYGCSGVGDIVYGTYGTYGALSHTQQNLNVNGCGGAIIFEWQK